MREAFEVNLLGHLDLTRAALAGMRERRYGRIVQMSSVVALTSVPAAAATPAPAALEAISIAVLRDEPPLHLPLGPEAFTWIRAQLNDRLEVLDAVEPLGADTAFAPQVGARTTQAG